MPIPTETESETSGLGAERWEELADEIALHGDYHVNDEGWTVCICGHVAEGDDDDGSHARHVAEQQAPLIAKWLAEDVEKAVKRHVTQLVREKQGTGERSGCACRGGPHGGYTCPQCWGCR